MSKQRVARFVSVGVFNTGFDFLLLNLLVFGFGFYKLWANVISTMTAMTVSYFLNHGFVFQDKKSRSKKQFLLFLVVTMFGLLIIQNIVIYLLTHQFSWLAEGIYRYIVEPIFGLTLSEEFVELNFAKAVATILTMIWNYELYKRLVFVNRQAPTNTV